MVQRTIVILFVLVGLGSCKQEKEPTKVINPYQTQLFKDVQLATLYKDSKSFVDLVPKQSYTILEAEYLRLKDNDDFDLKAFVEVNFEDRSMESLDFITDTTKTMYEHIEDMWDKLTRGPDEVIANSSRIPLPEKYVVPGGRFQEIYYWDSYFTLEGLLAADRKDLAKNMVDNFAFLIDSIGFIPNGTRDYYLTRSQPPFFSLMVDAVSGADEELLINYLPQLQKEYDFFMKHDTLKSPFTASYHVVQLKNKAVLNRYFDLGNSPRPEAFKEDMHLAADASGEKQKQQSYKDLRSGAASGWDFSSRWFGKADDFSSTETTSILPVDLNCLLAAHENLLSRALKLSGDVEEALKYRAKANRRIALIQEFMWNDANGFFMDYNFKRKAQTDELTLAGAYPLFFKIATPEQALKIKNTIMETFLKPGGLVTTLKNSGQQWDAPNGWAPLQWIAVNGLLNYGYTAEAKEIMNRWLALNEKVYRDTGKMMEKYNVEDLSLLSGGGEYETQDGFGWTNGVALGFKKLLDQMEATAH